MSHSVVVCIVALSILGAAQAVLPTACSSCQRSAQCTPPNCFCCRDDMDMSFPTSQIPQIVFFTFDDAVTEQVSGFYRNLFDPSRKNPNGCPISMTLFISHDNTKYNLVSEFYRRGMEIASHSVTHDMMNNTNFFQEAKQQKENLAKLANIPIEDVTGWRSPFLKPTGDLQPEALRELGYVYDATLTYSKRSYRTKPPGPFTLDFGWPFECQVKPCPKRSHPGFWEVPVVSLMDYKARYDCVYVDGCMNAPPDEEAAYQFLWDNFHNYYSNTRMPFGINMHPSWFYYPDRLKAMDRFILKLSTMQDVYIVSADKMIKWLKQPTPLNELYTFPQWACDGREKSTAEQRRDHLKIPPPPIKPPRINLWPGAQVNVKDANAKSQNTIIPINNLLKLTSGKQYAKFNNRNYNVKERKFYHNMPNVMTDKLREIVKPPITRSVPAPAKSMPQSKQSLRHMLWRPILTRPQPLVSPLKPQTNSVNQKLSQQSAHTERRPSIQDLFGNSRSPQTIAKQPVISNRVDPEKMYQSIVVAKPHVRKVWQNDVRRYNRNGQPLANLSPQLGAINIWPRPKAHTSSPMRQNKRTGKPVITNSNDFDRLLRRIQMPATSGRVSFTPLPTKPTYQYTDGTRRSFTSVSDSRLTPTTSPKLSGPQPIKTRMPYSKAPQRHVYTTESPISKQQRLHMEHLRMSNETVREQRARESYIRQQQLRELREKQFALRTRLHLNLQRSLLRHRQRELLRTNQNQIRPVRFGQRPLRSQERSWSNFIQTLLAPQ